MRCWNVLQVFIFLFSLFTYAENIEETFLRWFKINGGIYDGITVFVYPDMGRGLMAQKDLEEGNRIIFIPQNLVISAKRLRQSEEDFHKQFGKIFSTDEEIISAFLLYEVTKGKESFWYPYLSVLPVYIPNALEFTHEELSELQQTDFSDSIKRSIENIHTQYYNFINKCSSFWPDVKNISLSQYRWSHAVIDSRGLRFRGVIHLAPLADMFNYQPHPDPRVAAAGEFFLKHHILSEDGHLSVSIDRAYSPGQQVFEDYGDNSDRIYLQYHGFVPQYNPFRCLDLTGPPPSSLHSHTNELLKLFQFRFAPRICTPSNGTIGQGLETYLAIVAMDVLETKLCADYLSQSKSSPASTGKVSWTDISQFCGLEEVSKALQKFLSGAIAIRPDETEGLTVRATRRIQEFITEQTPAFPTSLETDERLLEALRQQPAADIGAAAGAVDVDITGSGAAVSNGSDGRVEQERHRIKLILAISHRLHVKRLWRDLARTYRIDTTAATADRAPQKGSSSSTTGKDVADFLPSKPTDDLQTRTSAFNEWFRSHCSNCSKIGVVPIPGYRLGTVADTAIPAEEEYLRVPLRVILDADKAFRDRAFRPFLQALNERFKRRDDFHELLFYLLHQKFMAREESVYWPYLQLLPEAAELDIPLFWSPEQRRARLGPSQLAKETETYATRVERFYHSGLKVDIILDFFPAEVLTFENYRWAYAILDSRSIWWQGKRHLVPLLDMINCQDGPPGSRVHSTALDETGKFAVTKAGWSFGVGDQLFEDYGQPNHIYFAYHGFSLPTNKHDCTLVSLGLEIAEFKRLDGDNDNARSVLQRLGATEFSQLQREGGVASLTSVCLGREIPQRVWLLLAIKLNVVENLFGEGKLGEPFPAGLTVLRRIIQSKLKQYGEYWDGWSAESGHKSSRIFLESEERTLRSVLDSQLFSSEDSSGIS